MASTTMDYEAAFEAAGTFGLVQKLIIVIGLYITAYGGWQATVPVFAAIDVPFYCAQTDHGVTPRPPNTTSFDSDCVQGCIDYVYSNDVNSIMSTFDLGCDSGSLLISSANSAYWVAFLISCFVSGFISDKFGRKWPALILTFSYFVATLVTALSPNIYVYIICRFVTGYASLAATLVYILMAECIDKKYLAYVGLTCQMIFVLGELACVLTGYLLKTDWRWQFIVMALPLVIYGFVHLFFLPESPRWLHSVGKTEETEQVLKWFAKINGKEPSKVQLTPSEDEKTEEDSESSLQYTTDSDTLLLKSTEDEIEMKAKITDLFGTPKAAMLTLCFMSSWFASSLVYYGLTYDVQNIGSNVYVNSSLLAITEVPAWLVCVAMDRWGRKKTLFVSLLISSISCIILPFTEPIWDGNLKIVLAMIAKCLSAGAFDMMYVYSPEVFPTVLRSTGLTLCSAAARLAVICAPFVIELDYGPYGSLPFLLFGGIGLLSTVMVLFFSAETLGRPFLNTVEDYYIFAAGGILEGDTQIRTEGNVNI